MKYNTNVRRPLIATLITFSSLIGISNAGVTILWKQVGDDVVATASGSLLEPNSFQAENTSSFLSSYVYSAGAYIGSPSSNIDVWTENISSGTFSAVFSSADVAENTGTFIGFGSIINGLTVDSSYVFGTALNATSTWLSTTLLELNLTEDDNKTLTYNTSATITDFMTLKVEVVPEPSFTALLGLGGITLILRRRK